MIITGRRKKIFSSEITEAEIEKHSKQLRAYQNRLREMDEAFEKACRISGKPLGWKAVREFRKEIMDVIDKIPPKKLPPRR